MNPLDQVAKNLPPSGLDFGYCPVKIPTTKSFSLFNPTQSTIRYTLTPADPLFSVSLPTGKHFCMPQSLNRRFSVTIL